jgi:hypothetical protein
MTDPPFIVRRKCKALLLDKGRGGSTSRYSFLVVGEGRYIKRGGFGGVLEGDFGRFWAIFLASVTELSLATLQTGNPCTTEARRKWRLRGSKIGIFWLCFLKKTWKKGKKGQKRAFLADLGVFGGVLGGFWRGFGGVGGSDPLKWGKKGLFLIKKGAKMGGSEGGAGGDEQKRSKKGQKKALFYDFLHFFA